MLTTSTTHLFHDLNRTLTDDEYNQFVNHIVNVIDSHNIIANDEYRFNRHPNGITVRFNLPNDATIDHINRLHIAIGIVYAIDTVVFGTTTKTLDRLFD